MDENRRQSQEEVEARLVPLGEPIHAECDACGAKRDANCDFQEHALVRSTIHTVTKNRKGHNHHIHSAPYSTVPMQNILS